MNRAEKAAYMLAWRKANRAHVSSNSKRYRSIPANRERYARWARGYRALHPDRRVESQRRLAKHGERIKRERRIKNAWGVHVRALARVHYSYAAAEPYNILQRREYLKRYNAINRANILAAKKAQYQNARARLVSSGYEGPWQKRAADFAATPIGRALRKTLIAARRRARYRSLRPEQLAISRAKYRARYAQDPTKFSHYRKVYARELPDFIVRNMLVHKIPELRGANIPAAMIESYRTYIRLKRLIRSKEHST